jgi:phytoene synthase
MKPATATSPALSRAPPPDLVRLSEEIIRNGSKSFAGAARLFDPATRASVHLLYAWCRHCDDVIDGQDLGHRTGAQPTAEEARRALALLRQKTSAALSGAPVDEPVFRGLQCVAHAHAIPHHHFHELLDGFAMDVEGRQYATLTETLDYCYHVAGVVGVMMSMIMGARDEDTLDRAADLGIAFQLTNIARDVVEDARCERVYLPRAWLDEAGLPPPPHLADAAHRERLFAVVERLLAVADGFYDTSRIGVVRLPIRCGWAVETARIVYREIGREVLRRGPRAWESRVSTSALQKVAAVARGALALGTARMFGIAPTAEREAWTRPKSDARRDERAYGH